MINEAQSVIERYRLVVAIIVAIVIALLLTTFSVMIYVRDGTSRLDLSRPGYEQARQQIRPDDTSPAFDQKGALTKEIMQQFSQDLNKKVDEFNQLSGFNSAPLEDEKLGLKLTE